MCQWGANMNAWAGYRMGLFPTQVSLTAKPGVEKSHCKIATKQLEIDENVNSARLV